MTYPNCDYADQNDTRMVNYHFDADTMTVYPVDHPAIAAFLAGGGQTGPYIAPVVTAQMPDLLPYQFRAMLQLSGHQAALDSYVAGLPDPQKTIAQAKLDYSLAFERHNSLVLAAQQALGLTDDQLNALWTQAAAIT